MMVKSTRRQSKIVHDRFRQADTEDDYLCRTGFYFTQYNRHAYYTTALKGFANYVY